MAHPPTALLFARPLAGDAAAVEQLVRRCFRPACAVALAATRVPAEAEVLVQESLIVALQRLGECREPARFQHWLLQIVRNPSLNRLEQQKVRDAHADAEQARQAPEAPPPASGDHALRRRLVEARGTLADREREVVLLHDLEGWTHAESADALETTEGTSRQYLFQARRKLRQLLEGLREVNPGD